MKLLSILCLMTSISFGQQVLLVDSVKCVINVKSYSEGSARGYNSISLDEKSILLQQDDDRYDLILTQKKYREVLDFINSAKLTYCEIPRSEFECNGGLTLTLEIKYGTWTYFYYKDPCISESISKECGQIEKVVDYLFKVSEELK